MSVKLKGNLATFEALSRIFPLVRLDGKAPVEKNWTDFERRSFDKIGFRSGDNAGIICGPPSGLIAIDVDNLSLFESACTRHNWDWPKTRAHETGSGNMHILFRYPIDGKHYGNKSIKTLGFDIRGSGGQIVAPGSIHPDTAGSYTVLYDVPIEPAPHWLLDIYAKEHPEWTVIQPDKLNVSDRIKKYICEQIDVGERSEPMMSVLTALLKAGLSLDQIYYVFYSFPIGDKFRGVNINQDDWLEKQIVKARDYLHIESDMPIEQASKDEKQVTDLVSAITRAVNLNFLELEIPQRDWVIEPLIYQGQIVMVYARAGVGKTFFALSMASAISQGGDFLGPYRVPAPIGVIYLDGEMPAVELHGRINGFLVRPNPERFKVISAEWLSQESLPVPNLMDPSWRAALLNFLKSNPQYRVIFLDNLSALTPGCDELLGLDWDPMNQWLMKLRRIGMTTILVHHAGKNNQQRGTSKREDQMDMILKLSKIDNRGNSAFKVEFEKARSLREEDKKAFMIEIVEEGSEVTLLYQPTEHDQLTRIAFLASKGLLQTKIAKELGIHQASVSRKINKAKEEGILTNELKLTPFGESSCASLMEG